MVLQSTYSKVIPDILTRLKIRATELQIELDPDPPTRVLLVKNGTDYIVSSTIMFREDQIRELVDKHGFFRLIPEHHHPIKTIHYLQHAKHIITQHGSISYTNFLFFNKEAIVYGVDICPSYECESVIPHCHAISREDIETNNWLNFLGISCDKS